MPSRTFIVNASPLILLARVGRLDLLAALADTVLVPAAVMQELAEGQSHDDAADVVHSTTAIGVVEDVPVPESVKVWDLGAGESQVLAQALARPGSEAVLDDLAARRCARALGLLTIGTLGVVITCRRTGVIAGARPLVEELPQGDAAHHDLDERRPQEGRRVARTSRDSNQAVQRLIASVLAAHHRKMTRTIPV